MTPPMMRTSDARIEYAAVKKPAVTAVTPNADVQYVGNQAVRATKPPNVLKYTETSAHVCHDRAEILSVSIVVPAGNSSCPSAFARSRASLCDSPAARSWKYQAFRPSSA